MGYFFLVELFNHRIKYNVYQDARQASRPDFNTIVQSTWAVLASPFRTPIIIRKAKTKKMGAIIIIKR